MITKLRTWPKKRTGRYCLIMAWILACMNIHTAMADLGEINIRLTGTVIALGCDVDPGDVDKPVVLGDWATKQLKKAGDHTHYIPFTIHLTGCSASGVTTAFTGSQDSVDHSLLALSTNDDGSSASGVGIQIMDNTQTRIPMGQDAPRAVVDDNGDVALNFYASYVATGNSILPGAANADTEFTLTYD